MAFVAPAGALRRALSTSAALCTSPKRSSSTFGQSATRAHVARAQQALGQKHVVRAGLEAEWGPFATWMKSSGESPEVGAWNELFRSGLGGGADPAQAIWVLERMQQSGRKATAATYEILLEICLGKNGNSKANDDRAAAFLLVEKMWADKVLLGDVSLPGDMEKTLRAILPPEAFD
jgi:hypothetical protein